MNKEFFPPTPDVSPKIYAYTDAAYPNCIKVGYTEKAVQDRVMQQYPTLRPNSIPYSIIFEENALRTDGTIVSDHEVHKELEKLGVSRAYSADNKKTEWFYINPNDPETLSKLNLALTNCKNYASGNNIRSLNFTMRPEQERAVNKTVALFKKWAVEYPTQKPHFLWNAKMRFGKTFTTYQFAKAMNFKRTLILTFKPAVEESWRDDLLSHVDFSDWQFVSKHSTSEKNTLYESTPLVCFGSFQDYLGRSQSGAIKTKNEWVHETAWDLIVFDEYHYGAWREKAQALTSEEEYIDIEDRNFEILEKDGNIQNDVNELENFMPISTKGYLYLSGTPFKALNSGEFAEDQIFSWTYSDEQRAKEQFKHTNETQKNPYASLPRMVMMTYQLPDSITLVAKGGEFDEFDLNEFFKASGKGKQSRFVNESEVQKWLDIIQGKFTQNIVDNLKLSNKKPPFPFCDVRLRSILKHTVWFLPNVASCDAMRNIIQCANTNNSWLKNNFTIISAYGKECGIGAEALKYAKECINGQRHNVANLLSKHKNNLETRTITLTCGKLTTGVTVKEWTGIFMLRNLKSPETYFQSAFRVQSPWTIKNLDGLHPNEETILKQECYIFDFAPTRALKQITDYSCMLNVNEADSEKKVKDFISFLPVLAYDGSTMTEVNASEILDIVLSGTTANLLARGWESALLVNVDNATLNRLINNKDAYEAVMRIEGFRKLGVNFLETIINNSEKLKKAKSEAVGVNDSSSNTNKLLREEEKDEKSRRKQVQEKLIKFATRIPVFMYLTDYRESSLCDVLTRVEPDVFKNVTGISIHDFDLLVSIGLFNENRLNDAVFKFRRYEEDSLSYTGKNKHTSDKIGGWNTVLAQKEVVDLD
ncbi:MAG: GIY-YIG nuclease family protein [Christensenellaceae bacterium]|jgi:hypothetical protein|nr:GIY-YIG nuclease family protein [Christensenellaceae bacterium]